MDGAPGETKFAKLANYGFTYEVREARVRSDSDGQGLSRPVQDARAAPGTILAADLPTADTHMPRTYAVGSTPLGPLVERQRAPTTPVYARLCAGLCVAACVTLCGNVHCQLLHCCVEIQTLCRCCTVKSQNMKHPPLPPLCTAAHYTSVICGDAICPCIFTAYLHRPLSPAPARSRRWTRVSLAVPGGGRSCSFRPPAQR